MIQTTRSKHSTTIHQPALPDEKLVHAAWVVAQSALWPAAQLSQKEIAAAREGIRRVLQTMTGSPATSTPFIQRQIGALPATNGNKVKAFAVFCQRVLLAWQYVQQDNRRYVPLPTTWLETTNAKGYAGTHRWYQQVEAIRSSLPQYRIALKAFAESIIDLITEPGSANFH